MASSHALIFFMKAPRPGTVKTRLQPQLTPVQSRALYMALAEDLLAHFRAHRGSDSFIYYTPPDGEAEMREWLGSDLNYVPQQGADLGEKMHRAFTDIFDRGYRKAALAGSDIPLLQPRDITTAFDLLDDHDAVFGPSEDGGYYLVALKAPQETLFRDITWSTGTVYRETCRKAVQAGLSLGEVERRWDLDTITEVRRLWALLNDPEMAGHAQALPRTRQVLAEIF